MGQFSWMFADTMNQKALHEGGEAYVALPGGGWIYEDDYDGYGRFDGLDIYDLVADWNRKYLSEHPEFLIPSHGGRWVNNEWVPDRSGRRVDRYEWYKAYADLNLSREEVVKKSGVYEYRHIGIDIACYDDQNAALPYPIKICRDKPVRYDCLPSSNADPNQGWGEPEDDDKDDWC